MSGLSWFGVHWPRPVATNNALELLRRLASERRRQSLVLEAIGQAGKVSHRVGRDSRTVYDTKHLLSATVPGPPFANRRGPRQRPEVCLLMHARHAANTQKQ